jgi:hypothetical protein
MPSPRATKVPLQDLESPTATPTRSPTPTPSPSPTPVALSGYRYTKTAARLYAERNTSSAVRLSLAADTQLAVTQLLRVNGVDWVTARRGTVWGYIQNSLLATTSAPKPLWLVRHTKQWSALRTWMTTSSPMVMAIAPGTHVRTESRALDHLGRAWIKVSVQTSSGTRRGHQLWDHTTTLGIRLAGTWTVLRSTYLYRYAYGTSLRLRWLAEGTLAVRRWAVKDTAGVIWTWVSVGSSTGWVVSAYLTPPYRQFIWNGRNPVTQQYTNYWCVPASVQTELNIGLNRYSTSYAFQQRVYYYGRANLGYAIQGRGLDPQAWARSLYYFSGARVRYLDATFGSFASALRAGVVQMRRTRLPVGLLVYYGGHAWTMIGYTATADPLKTSRYAVTGVYVAAPFVAWTDPPPGRYYTTAPFRAKMTPYWEAERWTRWNGRYTIILPSG